METKMIKFHQGDVQGRQIESIPFEARQVTNRPVAYGEHSGHQHCLTGDVALFMSEDGTFFAAVGSDGATLQHIHESSMFNNEIAWKSTKELPMADHKPLHLPKGNYEIWIQNSYNPFSRLMEKVID
jgi:hypothetical protein